MSLPINVVPVASMEALQAALPYILPGLEQIIKDTNGLSDYDVQRMIHDYMGQKATLWVIFVNGKYGGFVSTRIYVIPGLKPKKILNIDFAHRKPDAKFDLCEAVEQVLVDHSAAGDLDEARVQTTIQPFADKLVKDFQFHPGFTEYRRNLK